MFRLSKQLIFKVSSLQQTIEHTIRAALQPTRLEIVNESHKHSRGQDTHFNLLIVSPKFTNLTKVQQHQLVYAALFTLMKDIHALTITCYPEEQQNAEAWSLDCFHKKAK
jgi:BolA protein